MVDVFQKVTDKVVELLESGVAPWRQPWSGTVPTNLASMKPYNGINYLLLGCLGYESNYWLTFKQAQKLGGGVRAGEKSPCFVVYTDTWPVTVKQSDGTEKTELRWFLKYSPVFNLCQCRGIKAPVGEGPETRQIEPIRACVNFMASLREQPTLDVGQMAAYLPQSDKIVMPAINRFRDAASYHSVLFHELVHWSGAVGRLNRPQPMHSTDRPGYAKEELCAEVGSAFLCAHCGIDAATVEDSASYIDGWLKALQNDRRLVVDASRSARLAIEWLMGG